MIQIEFNLTNAVYPKCVATLDGDTVTIQRLPKDNTDPTQTYTFNKSDLKDILTHKRSHPHSPITIGHKDIYMCYQPLPNTLTLHKTEYQFCFEFGFFYLNEILNKV